MAPINWAHDARDLWYAYLRTCKNGHITEWSKKHLKGKPKLFEHLLKEAAAHGDYGLYDAVRSHLDTNFVNNFGTARLRALIGDNNVDYLYEAIEDSGEILNTVYDKDVAADIARDFSMAGLKHITSHGHKEHPVSSVVRPFAPTLADAADLAQDFYNEHHAHGNKRRRKYSFSQSTHSKKSKGPITEAENLFDVTQPAANLPKNQQSMYGTPSSRRTPSSGRNSFLFSTPRSIRSSARRSSRRVSFGRSRYSKLRPYKGRRLKKFRKRSFKKKSGLRNPGVSRSRKRLKMKRSRNVHVSRKLAKKIKKVIRGGLPSGRHITIENNRIDNSKSNRIYWHKIGLKNQTWAPRYGQCGEVFSPFEVLRKANETWLAKPINEVNYKFDPSTVGWYTTMGCDDLTIEKSQNLMPNTAGDKFMGAVPTIEVVKQYVKSEWVNMTQRTYYLEFYEIQSRRSGSHGIIGDPWTTWYKENKDLNDGDSPMGGLPASYSESYMKCNKNALDPGSGANLDDKISTSDASAYPYRPEWLPGWNKAWKFKKTKICLEPGQSYVYNLKGWTGKLNYRKLFRAGSGATINMPDGKPYVIDGVQKNLNRWVMVGIYTDIVASKKADNTHVRVGRLDHQTGNGGEGIFYETTSVLKMKYPEVLLMPVPRLKIQAGQVWVAQDNSDNGVAQGGNALYTTEPAGHYFASSRRPRLVLYSKLIDDAWGYNSENTIVRYDETNPQTVEAPKG